MPLNPPNLHRRTAAFTVIEISIVLGLIAIFVGGALGALAFNSKLREQRVIRIRLQTVDTAQLEYLRKHPGCSLATPDAATEVTAIVDRITQSRTDSRLAADNAYLRYLTVDVTQRPVQGRYKGITVTP